MYAYSSRLPNKTLSIVEDRTRREPRRGYRNEITRTMPRAGVEVTGVREAIGGAPKEQSAYYERAYLGACSKEQVITS
jgi:hypothetical protein